MKLCIIHLSDIHFKEDEQAHIELATEIARVTFSTYRNSDHCLLAITGDVAFSGKKSEYKIANEFLQHLTTTLISEKNIPIDYAIAPGNHDCDLSENPVRDIVISTIKGDPSKAENEDLINLCTKVQSNFFEFRKKYTLESTLHEDPLWLEQSISIGKKIINISSINAAWMSSLEEKQGTLVYPIEKYDEIIENPTIRFTLLHHPLNWYCQHTYHNFRATLQQCSSIIFSGHEHTPNLNKIENPKSPNSSVIHIEAKATDPKVDNSGISLVTFCTETNSVTQKTFSRRNFKLIENPNEEVSTKISDSDQKNLIKRSYLEEISHLGATIKHPDKKILSMSDVYIDPEFEQLDEEIDSGSIRLAEVDFKNKTTLILGDEQSGKTKLLHNQFNSLTEKGIYPIFLDVRTLRRTTENELIKHEERSIKNTYKDNEFHRLSRSERAILIDNFDHIATNTTFTSTVINYIKSNYSTIIICADEILDTAISSNTKLFNEFKFDKKLKIRDFGRNSRIKLIKKWHQCSNNQERENLEKAVHKTESIINTALGRNLIPSRPIYLLTLLQSTSSQDSDDLQNSGMSYYYQYLITKSLEEAGTNKSKFDEIFHYLSNLSWFMKSTDSNEISYNELSKFNNSFSENFTTINLEKQIDLLKRAKIISEDSKYFTFSYPYIRYFFIGKYLADNIDQPEVISRIKEFCSDLSTRENSNTILFLTHHKNSDWVIDQVSENLNSCFADQFPVYFGNDSANLNDLVGTVSELVVNKIDVEHNQEIVRDIKDTSESNESTIESKRAEREEDQRLITEVFKMMRGSEVLGQILKNYYGSINRQKKQEYIREISEAPLRLLHFIFESTIKNPKNIIEDIEDRLKKKNISYSQDELRDITKGFISAFISHLSTGVIMKSSESINSEKLLEDICSFSEKNPQNAFKLIEVSSYLLSPNRLPLDKIRKIAKDLEDSPLAFHVFQNLAYYHIQMFHTPDNIKMKLGSYVKINLSAVKSLPKDR